MTNEIQANTSERAAAAPSMPLPADLFAAANRLGAALGSSPVVQDYLQAEAVASADPEVAHLEAEVSRVYNELLRRQQSGEVLFPYEVNEYYKMRDRWVNHPLMARRAECRQALQALFGQASSLISSILTVDYTELVG